MPSEEVVIVNSKQLQPGMYVFIDLGWMDHPFPLSRFKIKSEDQIRRSNPKIKSEDQIRRSNPYYSLPGNKADPVLSG
jgi:hypothetical protein